MNEPRSTTDPGRTDPARSRHQPPQAPDPSDAPLATMTWEELVNRLADGVVAADAEGTITYWNEAAERVFGWPRDEAVGQSLNLIIPERQRERHWDGYRRVAATGKSVYGAKLLEVPALHRSGRALSIAFTLTLIPASDGSVARFVAVVRDDTARWQERRELRAEVARTCRQGTTNEPQHAEPNPRCSTLDEDRRQ